MNKIFFSVLLFICGSVFAQKSEADFLLLQKDYVLYEDGSSDMRCQKIVKYNTHVSFNRLYGETFIVYNPQQQQLKINESYTIQADGNKIITPSNAFNEVLPRFAANAPAYNHLREMVVTHTGLEIGATAYLIYTLHNQAGYEPELDRFIALQEESPVKEYKITVTIPDSKNLSFLLYGRNETPKITQKDGSKRYEWTFHNVPASSREYYQPEDGRNVPHLIFSTWASQQEALQWLAAQLKTGDSNELSATLNRIEKSASESRDNFAQLTGIHKYLTNNIAYTPIPAEYAGYRFREASQVIKTAYGTVGEKAALLLALAKESGMEARPVAVYPSFMDGATASLHAIADIVVAVNIDENEFVMSPVKNNEKCLSVVRPNWRYLPMTGNSAEIIAQKCNNAVLFMEIVANSKQITTSGYSQMVVSECGKIDSPVENKEKHIEGSLPIKGDENLFFFTLPEVPGGANSWTLPFLASKRTTTLEIPYPVFESYTYRLQTTDDMEFINKDITIEKKNVLGTVKIVVKREAANSYTITRNLNLRKSIITPAEYDAFIELISVWRESNYRTFYFK